jgi:DNA-binding ferritin-like protein
MADFDDGTPPRRRGWLDWHRFEDAEPRLDRRFDGVAERLRAVEKLVPVQQRGLLDIRRAVRHYPAKEVEARLAELERKVAALRNRR